MSKTLAVTDAARAKARDFIDNEKQFQLGFLPTEQSNPITATLEEDFRRSTLAGVQCLQRGDRQMPITMRHVFAGAAFAKLVDSMVATLQAPPRSPDSNTQTFKNSNISPLPRIVFSGCGATGRLSILLESMWRDFFHRRAKELTDEELKLADRSASIMTGGDFALIRSVEFFEDYAEGGRRQAAALDVGAGDTFVAITEGGETSSVRHHLLRRDLQGLWLRRVQGGDAVRGPRPGGVPRAEPHAFGRRVRGLFRETGEDGLHSAGRG